MQSQGDAWHTIVFYGLPTRRDHALDIASMLLLRVEFGALALRTRLKPAHSR